MKKLYLILFLPSLTICGDHPIASAIIGAIQAWQQFERNNPNLAGGIKYALAEAAQNEAKAQQQERINEYYEIQRLQQERLKLEAEKKRAEEEAKFALEEAKRKEAILNQELDVCLHEHFHRRENSHGFPQRCSSPARKYAAVNELAADQLIAKHLQKKGTFRQHQLRIWL